MKTLIVLISLLPGISFAEDVFQQARTSILITPVACHNKTLCNVFHARFINTDGVVMFNRDIQSAWMASNVSIEVRTVKGTLMIWSDR